MSDTLSFHRDLPQIKSGLMRTFHDFNIN